MYIALPFGGGHHSGSVSVSDLDVEFDKRCLGHHSGNLCAGDQPKTGTVNRAAGAAAPGKAHVCADLLLWCIRMQCTLSSSTRITHGG